MRSEDVEKLVQLSLVSHQGELTYESAIRFRSWQVAEMHKP